MRRNPLFGCLCHLSCCGFSLLDAGLWSPWFLEISHFLNKRKVLLVFKNVLNFFGFLFVECINLFIFSLHVFLELHFRVWHLFLVLEKTLFHLFFILVLGLFHVQFEVCQGLSDFILPFGVILGKDLLNLSFFLNLIWFLLGFGDFCGVLGLRRRILSFLFIFNLAVLFGLLFGLWILFRLYCWFFFRFFIIRLLLLNERLHFLSILSWIWILIIIILLFNFLLKFLLRLWLMMFMFMFVFSMLFFKFSLFLLFFGLLLFLLLLSLFSLSLFLLFLLFLALSFLGFFLILPQLLLLLLLFECLGFLLLGRFLVSLGGLFFSFLLVVAVRVWARVRLVRCLFWFLFWLVSWLFGFLFWGIFLFLIFRGRFLYFFCVFVGFSFFHMHFNVGVSFKRRFGVFLWVLLDVSVVLFVIFDNILFFVFLVLVIASRVALTFTLWCTLVNGGWSLSWLSLINSMLSLRRIFIFAELLFSLEF